jgi:Rhodopirellula transposase DDE domain
MTMSAELTEPVIETIKSAARKLTGYRRRQFQAEVAEQYCEGVPRRAETVFGWGREAVQLGLHERRTGLRCVDDYSSRGRHKTEDKLPALSAEIRALVEPESQADPKFQTPLAYTRMTAQAVHERLTAQATKTSDPVPAERTLHDILNRLGDRLRRVQKTKPQKSSRDRRDLRPSPAGAHAGRR